MNHANDGDMATKFKESSKLLNLKENHEVAFRDVDDALITQTNGDKQSTKQQTKSEHADEVIRKSAEDFQSICEGLFQEMGDIGINVSSAASYQGIEKVYSLCGKFGWHSMAKMANATRMDRLKHLTTQEAVKVVGDHVTATIHEIGESERENKIDKEQFELTISHTQAKLKDANPLYLSTKAKREKAEAEYNDLQTELQSGTVTQEQRPEKEIAFEAKTRELAQLKLDEKKYYEIVEQAQKALPTLIKNRNAADEEIQGLHMIRQSLLEKFENLKVILERSASSIRATARVKMFKAVDPAFNMAIESATRVRIAALGTTLDAIAERMKHAAIDPVAANELLQELTGNIETFAKELSEAELKTESDKHESLSA